MTRLYLTAPEHYGGEVAITYDDAGRLSVLDFSGAEGLPDKPLGWMLQNVPLNYHRDFAGFARSKGFGVAEEKAEITFEMFWDGYAKKVNAKRCETIWKRLSRANQAKAYAGIKRYDRHLAANSWKGKADPETYLKKEYWTNSWQ